MLSSPADLDLVTAQVLDERLSGMRSRFISREETLFAKFISVINDRPFPQKKEKRDNPEAFEAKQPSQQKKKKGNEDDINSRPRLLPPEAFGRSSEKDDNSFGSRGSDNSFGSRGSDNSFGSRGNDGGNRGGRRGREDNYGGNRGDSWGRRDFQGGDRRRDSYGSDRNDRGRGGGYRDRGGRDNNNHYQGNRRDRDNQRGDVGGYQRGDVGGYQRGDVGGFQRGGDGGFQRGDAGGFQRGDAGGFQRGDAGGLGGSGGPDTGSLNGPTGSLLTQLAECAVKSEGDAELARNVIGLLLKSLKEYSITNGESKIAELLLQAELKMSTIKALKVGLRLTTDSSQGSQGLGSSNQESFGSYNQPYGGGMMGGSMGGSGVTNDYRMPNRNNNRGGRGGRGRTMIL